MTTHKCIFRPRRPALYDLLVAVRPAKRIADYPSAVDLRELLALPAVQDNTRLWFDAADRLVGFAFVDHYQNLRFEFDPQVLSPGIEAEIVAWGVDCIRRVMQATGESFTLDASCREDDTGYIALLERHGFIQEALRSVHMVRSLYDPIPAPHLPAGFSIRHVTGEHEVDALVALHRAAFGTEHMTVEERLAMMRVPDYELELDLVVVAPDGRLQRIAWSRSARRKTRAPDAMRATPIRWRRIPIFNGAGWRGRCCSRDCARCSSAASTPPASVQAVKTWQCSVQLRPQASACSPPRCGSPSRCRSDEYRTLIFADARRFCRFVYSICENQRQSVSKVSVP